MARPDIDSERPVGSSSTPRHRREASGKTADRGHRSASFRPDIQGLRAIAVALVVVYHLFPSAVPGGFVGVDVFFVISGFVITGHLARTHARTGRLRLVEFYASRARRLMPAAVTVLVATWFAARYVLPVTQLPDTAQQIRASALYFQNWTLAHDAVSYLKSSDAPTPVQHFWSLSVEEQFYVVWPLVFVAAGLIAAVVSRRKSVNVRAVIALLAAGVVVVSLWYSVHETAANPAAAYFVTPTRIWELGLGGVLALLPARLTGAVGRFGALSWVGLALVIGSAVELTGDSAFPGWIAVVPVCGSALMIMCGSREGRLSTAPVTTRRPMVFLGDISYSLYLWHWPVIVLWQAERRTTGHQLSLRAAVVVAAISLLLAWASKVLIEDPARYTKLLTRHRWWSLSTALVAIVPVAIVSVWLGQQPGPYTAHVDAAHPGGAVLAGTATAKPNVTPVPPLAQVDTDYEVASNDNCQAAPLATAPKTCVFGDTTTPTKTVALVGDSAAGQWSSALAKVARAQHWKLVVLTHSSCPWSATLMTETGHNAPYRACQQWGRTVLSMLQTSVRPDVVITSDRPVNGVPSHPRGNAATRKAIGVGMATYWSRLAAHHIPVVALRETPEMGQDIPTCLARHGNTAQDCTAPASAAIYRHTAAETAVSKVPSSTLIDMNELICGSANCEPIVGNVIVYRDAHHLTNTYSLTLEPFLAAKLKHLKATR